MAFGGNTRDLSSFGEETDKTTDLHKNLLKNDAYSRGDSVASIKRRRHDLSSDNVEDLKTGPGHNKLKSNLEDLTWYTPDHSSSDHFSSDDSLFDSSSDSSSDYSSDSSSGHSLPDSPTDAQLLFLRGHLARGLEADIDVDTAAAEAAADVGVEVGIGSDGEDKAKEEAESRDRGTIKIGVDRVSDIESAQREEEHRMLAASEKRTGVLDRIGVLERDNMCVGRERVDGHQRHMSYTQDKLRQMRVTMPTATCTGMKPAAIEEVIERRVAEALEAYEANKNHGPTIDRGDKREDDNGDGNGNTNGDVGNRNGNIDMNVGGLMPIAHECTYKDFLKCQPLIFKGTEGVVGMTRWFEKMDTVFHINNCPQKYQVKYASCTLQNGTLTWWNSHKRIVGTDVAYA
ncbi:hypothetical protein Tco_0884846 [Tanacetum coccineum]